MNYLYKVHQKKIYRPITIIFWVPGGMPGLLHIEGAIAAALRLRGVNVHAIICNGASDACALRNSLENIPFDKWYERCDRCSLQTRYILEGLGIPFSYIGDYVDSDTKKILKKLSRKNKWQDLNDFVYKKIQLGKNVRSAIIKYFMGNNMKNLDYLTYEYSYAALLNSEAATNVCKKYNPTKMFMSHGIYTDWGPALNIALQKNIPVIGWMTSYLTARFYFRHVYDDSRIDFHNINNNEWKILKEKPFSEYQNNILMKYLDDRYKKNISFDMKQTKRYLGNTDNLINKFKLRKNKPIWGIMAHLNWDAASDFAPMAYDSYDDWMMDTINTIIKYKDVQWVIKIHPAEIWEKTKNGVLELINKHFPKLPNHIKIIDAKEKVSPLDFIRLIDGGITIFGTLGLEMALHGKPVILAGEAHYGQKGFTYDGLDKKNYRDLLKRAKSINKLNKNQQLLAKKYAYCYFIQRQIPIPVVMDPKSIWWKFNYKKRNLLIPGKDPFIDFICDRIIDGKDFIMNERLVKLSESY